MTEMEKMVRYFTENLKNIFYYEDGVEQLELEELEDKLYINNMEEDYPMLIAALEILHDPNLPEAEKIHILSAIKNQCFGVYISKRCADNIGS